MDLQRKTGNFSGKSFRDVIISDGLVVPYRVIIGGNMKREYKDVYMAAKKSGQIYRSL